MFGLVPKFLEGARPPQRAGTYRRENGKKFSQGRTRSEGSEPWPRQPPKSGALTTNGRKSDVTLIDADVHNYPDSMDELLPHLSRRWQAYVKQSGFTLPSVSIYPKLYAQAARRDAWPPSGRRPGADADFAREQLLDTPGISTVRSSTRSSRCRPYEISISPTRCSGRSTNGPGRRGWRPTGAGADPSSSTSRTQTPPRQRSSASRATVALYRCCCSCAPTPPTVDANSGPSFARRRRPTCR